MNGFQGQTCCNLKNMLRFIGFGGGGSTHKMLSTDFAKKFAMIGFHYGPA